MRVQSVHIKDFKRFTDLTVSDIPETARLVTLSVRVKQLLALTQCGNTKEAFCVATLAPLVAPNTQIYGRLKADVFREVVA